MPAEQVGNLTIRRPGNFQEAQARAVEESVNTLGQVLPVVLFRQGNRVNLSGAMTFGMVARLLYSNSATARDNMDGVASSTNRPEDKKHSEAIAEYIQKNKRGKFYLGSLSLNVQEPLTLYTSETESKLQIAYLVLPYTAKISITDGQHRHSAIKKALDKLSSSEIEEFQNESISVLITCETEIDQIHQDFADASKTKALPPGLLAVYDRRNPANRVVVELERKVTMLRGRVDSTSKTLSKNSSLLYTANQLRQFVKVFLTGSWQMASADFEKNAYTLLEVEDGVFERELAKATDFLNYLADRLPVWKQIARLPAGGTTAAQIRDLRQEGYVCLSAAGLVIIASVGHALFKVAGTDWKPYADRLAQIDWRTTGEIWKGNIVSEGKILVQQALIRQATKKVKEYVGLINLPDDDAPNFGEALAPSTAIAA